MLTVTDKILEWKNVKRAFRAIAPPTCGAVQLRVGGVEITTAEIEVAFLQV